MELVEHEVVGCNQDLHQVADIVVGQLVDGCHDAVSLDLVGHLLELRFDCQVYQDDLKLELVDILQSDTRFLGGRKC